MDQFQEMEKILMQIKMHLSTHYKHEYFLNRCLYLLKIQNWIKYKRLFTLIVKRGHLKCGARNRNEKKFVIIILSLSIRIQRAKDQVMVVMGAW